MMKMLIPARGFCVLSVERILALSFCEVSETEKGTGNIRQDIRISHL